jgi:hypothetical protein
MNQITVKPMVGSRQLNHSFFLQKRKKNIHRHLDVEVHLEDDGAGLEIPVPSHQAVPAGQPELPCAAHHSALDGLPVAAEVLERQSPKVVSEIITKKFT